MLGSDDIAHLPFRISYCTADKMHGKVFAYIAQSQHTENLECHAFLCTKRKMVSAERPGLGQPLALPWRPCPWGPCLVERQDQGDTSLKRWNPKWVLSAKGAKIPVKADHPSSSAWPVGSDKSVFPVNALGPLLSVTRCVGFTILGDLLSVGQSRSVGPRRDW